MEYTGFGQFSLLLPSAPPFPHTLRPLRTPRRSRAATHGSRIHAHTALPGIALQDSTKPEPCCPYPSTAATLSHGTRPAHMMSLSAHLSARVVVNFPIYFRFCHRLVPRFCAAAVLPAVPRPPTRTSPMLPFFHCRCMIVLLPYEERRYANALRLLSRCRISRLIGTGEQCCIEVCHYSAAE